MRVRTTNEEGGCTRGITYRWVNFDSEKLGFPAFGVHKLVFGRLLLLEEDIESTRDTLDAEEIVSGVAFSMGRSRKKEWGVDTC